MNFTQQNLWGIFIGGLTALAGWTINQWAAAVGIVGVLVNLYLAFRRHRREERAFAYEHGLKPDRRSIDCLRCDLFRRETDQDRSEK